MAQRKRQAVLVTGGAKRLGAQVALHFARKGYDIALHYNTSTAQARQTAKHIQDQGVRCELFQADLSVESDVRVLFLHVQKAFPSLAILVNSASIFIPNQLNADHMDLYSAHWDINFKAPYILSCLFAKSFKKGHIINFIDTNVSKYTTQHSDYLLTKKALAEFTRMAAVQWGPAIRVNGVAPGMILPPVDRPVDDRLQRSSKIPLKRVGHGAYILKAMDALVENDYITGEIIAVDGGEQLV